MSIEILTVLMTVLFSRYTDQRIRGF